MANVSKIRIGDNVFNIVPSLGDGFTFGTAVSTNHKIYVHTGNASVYYNSQMYDTGIGISYGKMEVNSSSLTTFLKALGFKTE